MHQDSPNIRMVGVKMTQELYRKTEKRVRARRMKDVSQLIRFLVTEETVAEPLTADDLRIIKERIEAKAGRGKSKSKGDK